MHLSAGTPRVPAGGRHARRLRQGRAVSARRQAWSTSTSAGAPYCEAARDELDAINGTMRGMLAPVILGAAAAGYLAHAGQAAAPPAGSPPRRGTVTGFPGTGRVRRPRRRRGGRHRDHVTLTVPHRRSPTHEGAVQGPVRPERCRRQPPDRQGSGPASPGPRDRIRPSPGPAPTKPGGRSPRPTPSGSASPRRRRPHDTAAPGPSGSSGPVATAKLSVSVSVAGLLNLGVVDVATVSVSDPGTAATDGLTASLGLPAGITLLGLGVGVSRDGRVLAQVARTRQSARGRAATVSFRILVASLAGCGNPITATAASGTLSLQASPASRCSAGPDGGCLFSASRRRSTGAAVWSGSAAACPRAAAPLTLGSAWSPAAARAAARSPRSAVRRAWPRPPPCSELGPVLRRRDGQHAVGQPVGERGERALRERGRQRFANWPGRRRVRRACQRC